MTAPPPLDLDAPRAVLTAGDAGDPTNQVSENFTGAVNVSQPVRLHGPFLVAVFGKLMTAPKARRA